MKSTPKNSQQPAFSWLANGAVGEQIFAKIALHKKIKKSLFSVLPETLASQCEILRLEQQHLILSVPTSALASKLRQLTPRIITHFSTEGWLLKEVIVKVQVNSANWEALKKTTPIRPEINTEGMQAFKNLANNLQNKDLKTAVERLLSRRK